MITSLHLTPTHLFSLTNTPTISVYSLQDFVPIINHPLPKLESSLGICLRKPNAVFQLPFQSGEVKFVEENGMNDYERDFLVVYDRKNVIGLDLQTMVSKNAPKAKIVFQLNIDLSSTTQEKGVQITSVLIFNNQQTSESSLLITTTAGKLHLMTITLSKTLNFITSTTVQQLSSPTSKIIMEEEEQSLKLIPSQHHHQDNEFISVPSYVNNDIYLVTNQGKLLTLEKETLKLKAVFENDFGKNGIKGTSSSLGQPLKIVFVTNSVLVLYNRAIVQYNAYTHTLTNTISLPVPTLDITIMQSPKTLSSSLLLTGECNSLYSMDFPFHSLTKNPQNPLSIKTKSVNISSRLGKCIQSKNNIVFVGGSDGTIDVLVNGEMGLVVLVQDR